MLWGFFSFFSNFSKPDEKVATVFRYSDYFTKDMIWEVVSSSGSMMLFFTKKDGWIGANRYFFETFGFKGVEDFRKKYESIREIF